MKKPIWIQQPVDRPSPTSPSTSYYSELYHSCRQHQDRMCSAWSKQFFIAVGWCIVTLNCRSSPSGVVHAFVPSVTRIKGFARPTRNCFSTSLPVSTDDTIISRSSEGEEDDSLMDDQTLLKKVPKSQLVDLCSQYQLSTNGTKEVLLYRLRDFAKAQADLERQRRKERISRVESGGTDSKERYEIVSEYPEEDDDEGFFYFEIKDPKSNNTAAASKKKKPTQHPYTTNAAITAPPPPKTEPNERGERVVTVYSTTDQNDLTGVASAQPGQTFTDNPLMSGEASTPSGNAAPWDMTQHKTKANSEEVDEAKEMVAELVHTLLAMTGAPAFREEFSEGVTPLGKKGQKMPPLSSPQEFTGFDPSKVSTDILMSSSAALRTGRGQVLQDVLREYELRAIGNDGMAGDDVEKGGGHYREVSRVRAFLEGYRRAEVRRVARETTTMLLDKIVTEGVEGLDLMLASMTRSSDDTNDAGELNDSLLDFLNDAIRQQEKKVEQVVGSGSTAATTERNGDDVEVDETAKLWNVTNENGSRVETIDPNDPVVRKVLEEEASKAEGEVASNVFQKPKTASEQLLLLLCLLRDRIKAEAAFGNDEKGRNLRILAHCLHSTTAADREQLIMKEMGSSLSRLESFAELLTASIEYAESTTHQLQPSKTGVLNVRLLKSILDLTEEIREKQSWKAAGVTPKHHP